MTKSITGKLIVVLTLCLGIIHGAGTYLDYYYSRTEILERVRLQSRDTVNRVVDELEHWLQGVQGSTLLISRILEQRKYTLLGLRQLLQDVVTHDTDIFGATIALNPKFSDKPQGFAPYYYHKDGAVIYADLARENHSYWQQDWYLSAVRAAKPVWIEPYYDDGGGEVLMTTYSVPVYHLNETGERFLYAVVTADVALDKLHRYLQRLKLGASGSGVLISKKGVVLSAEQPEAIMQNYLDVLSGPQDKDVWQRSFNAALHGESLIFPIACPIRRGQCNAQLSALASTGWPVGVLYSKDEILAPVRAYGIKTALTGVATLLLMALVVSLVTRRLTKPLVALAKASDSIARGELDVPLPRMTGQDEVARLVQSFQAMKRDLKSYISDLEVATAGKARLEGELAAATQIQMSMLPQGGEALEETPLYSLWAKVRPAKSVGGDLYTFYQHGESELFIVVGDVSDKGVPAALFMAKAISHIQQFEKAFESPAQGMTLLNNALERGNDNCMFVTLFFGVVDLQTLELRFASAGHTAPGLLRDGQVTELAQNTGPALGLVADLIYPENTVTLRAGDRLAIYTDGIDEAFNADGKMFNTEGFFLALGKTAAEPVATAGGLIFGAIDKFVGTTPQSDDITLMLVDLASTSSTQQVHHFACPTHAVDSTCDWLLALLKEHGIDTTPAMEILLVAEEILTNIQKYAGLEEDAIIDLNVMLAATHIRVEFSDTGTPFNPLSEGHTAHLGDDIESAEIGGLGVHLIRQLTDKQTYRHSAGKNILLVEKQLANKQG